MYTRKDIQNYIEENIILEAEHLQDKIDILTVEAQRVINYLEKNNRLENHRNYYNDLQDLKKLLLDLKDILYCFDLEEWGY